MIKKVQNEWGQPGVSKCADNEIDGAGVRIDQAREE